MQWTGMGSMMTVHFRRGAITNPADAAGGDQGLRELFFHDMLQAGFYLARRGMAALSLEIAEADRGAFCAAVEDFVGSRTAVLG